MVSPRPLNSALRQERQRQERKGEMSLRERRDGLPMNVQEARELSGMVSPRPLNSALRQERQKKQEWEGVRLAPQQTRKHKAGSCQSVANDCR